MRYRLLLAAAILGPMLATPLPAAGKLSPAETARQADEVLLQELLSKGTTKPRAPRVDDEGFIRRVTLDVLGRVPTPGEVSAFVLDPSPTKRTALVRRLLADPAFGKNWGRYWRDVILYRASEPRAMIFSAQALEKYLTEKFNDGSSWKDITRAFITATGDVREKGETALIMAQNGATEDTTAEISRIFMGIQIQCAQCHDHPSDRWKREQFHELAAFMPRIRLQQVRDGQRRSFEVVSVNRQRRFGRNRGQTEHYMPDLDNPTARGTLMTPKFFVTNRTLETGKPDEERRTMLANWLTSSRNPWFTRAFVNRMWAEMVGEGFYEPIDDLGPDRFCSAPETLKLLSAQFMVNQYDIKWLFETIASTEAYQRASRQRRDFGDTPFTANCPQRLRGDQLFTALSQVLEIPEQARRGGRRPSGPYGRGGPRTAFNQTFGFDPSTPREEVAGSIPQALYMMNNPLVNAGISARRPGSVLFRLLREVKDDKAVTIELYLRCLAREPKPAELRTCLDHVREVADRGEAFEDVFWALVNSTEFLHRK